MDGWAGWCLRAFSTVQHTFTQTHIWTTVVELTVHREKKDFFLSSSCISMLTQTNNPNALASSSHSNNNSDDCLLFDFIVFVYVFGKIQSKQSFAYRAANICNIFDHFVYSWKIHQNAANGIKFDRLNVERKTKVKRCSVSQCICCWMRWRIFKWNECRMCCKGNRYRHFCPVDENKNPKNERANCLPISFVLVNDVEASRDIWHIFCTFLHSGWHNVRHSIFIYLRARSISVEIDSLADIDVCAETSPNNINN